MMRKKDILPKVEIRKAKISDLKPFWLLFGKTIRENFPEYPRKAKNFLLKTAYSRKKFKKWVKEKEGIILIALIKNKIIGYIVVESCYAGVALLAWLAIDKNFQGKGMGSLLLKRYEIFAKKQKVHKIYLWTDKRDLKFYKKNGYILLGRIPKFFFKVDHWLCYKDI